MMSDIFKSDFSQETMDHLAMLIPMLFQISGMVFAVLADSYIDRTRKRVLLIIAILVLSLMTQNYVENLLATGKPRISARTLAAIYGYTVRPVILVLCLYVISPDRRAVPAWILVGVNAAVHLTALFSHICFWISDTNHYNGGPLSNMCLYTSLALLADCIYLTVREYGHMRKKEMFIPLFNSLIVIVAIILDGRVGLNEQPVTFLTESIVSSSVFYYIWLHLQFVREHERDLKAQQRIQIMMTQIQPHFLYNTIENFRALCGKEPEKAAEVAGKFGQYLRQNMDFLDAEGLIPFGKEFQHTKLYAEIEMVRFPYIRVEYDIKDDAFQIPPLTIQPMVENAIRHGVRIREGGIVRVRAWKEAGEHVVSIEDNGTGFDTGRIEKVSGRHIGIRNVRERIEKMCDGTFHIESREGTGTTVTIRIPEKVENL